LFFGSSWNFIPSRSTAQSQELAKNLWWGASPLLARTRYFYLLVSGGEAKNLYWSDFARGVGLFSVAARLALSCTGLGGELGAVSLQKTKTKKRALAFAGEALRKGRVGEGRLSEREERVLLVGVGFGREKRRGAACGEVVRPSSLS
jgi:hypothetical protein